MSAKFEPAVKYVLQNEDFRLSGKVTPEPNGGKARFGINSVFHPKAVHDGFYEMPKDVALSYAISVYEKDYWTGRGFDQIENQALATKLFDMAVNMGNSGEIEVLQKALDLPIITRKMDQTTKLALSQVDSSFIDKLVSALEDHYRAIHNAHPDKYKDVINGWLARAAKIPAVEEEV